MKPGDEVVVIADSISGTVKSINDTYVEIEDHDGFLREYMIHEIAPVTSKDYRLNDDRIDKEIRAKIEVQKIENNTQLKSFEIDLHIEELLDDHRYLTNTEILLKQMSVCKSFVQNALQNETKRIVLIHGKGEGVLKSEIHSFLNNLRNFHQIKLEYHDAPFTQYGMGGATEIIFH